MTMADQRSRFRQPEKICDIVLKGGITSGVVYPLALVSLAEKYRFSNIGGTSAGAMAAVAAAAAEYGRHTEDAGFDRLARIPEELGPNLLSMFQPTPALKPLFDISSPP
jgi:predicted acylesterase/phospholipase RssA